MTMSYDRYIHSNLLVYKTHNKYINHSTYSKASVIEICSNVHLGTAPPARQLRECASDGYTRQLFTASLATALKDDVI